MPRLSLIDENATPEIAALAGKIRGGRGGQLHVFYQALLHTPSLAAAWFEFNNAVRFQTSLNDRTRELVIMRVSALTGCDYVWSVHEEKYAAAAGLTPQEVSALRDWRKSGVYGNKECALLAYVDAVTRDVAVPNAVFDDLRKHYSEQEILELTVLIGAYNMQARLLKALDFKPENV
jgi:4-carboxymuconolactone decarboxylase